MNNNAASADIKVQTPVDLFNNVTQTGTFAEKNPADTSIDSQNETNVQEVNNSSTSNKKGLKELFILVKTQYLTELNKKSKEEMATLQARSDQIIDLRNCLQAINLAAGSSGAFDCSKNTELTTLLKKASDLGAKIDVTKTSYTKEETDSLKGNVRMSMDNLLMKNDLLMQTIQQFIQETHLGNQFAKDNAKTLHDMLIAISQKIAR